jgi:hypothetical protein
MLSDKIVEPVITIVKTTGPKIPEPSGSKVNEKAVSQMVHQKPNSQK